MGNTLGYVNTHYMNAWGRRSQHRKSAIDREIAAGDELRKIAR
jgi:hypothetical protein